MNHFYCLQHIALNALNIKNPWLGWGMYLSCQHEELGLILQTYVKKAGHGGVVYVYKPIPLLGVGSGTGGYLGLTSQTI